MKRSINEDLLFDYKLVEKHYSPGNLMMKITNALKTEGKDINSITADDLTFIEEFHIRGREATQQLVERLDIKKDSHVLDLGSGIGGMSRYIALRYNCKVTGLDLSEEFCSTARELSRIVAPDRDLTFTKGDATKIPCENNEFDFVLTQHVQMNIANKDKFLFEVFRVLKPGGFFALHDIFRSTGAPQVDFPVPWAENDSISFLTEWENYKSLIENNGFIFKEEEDVTEPGINWLNAMTERAAQVGHPPVSIQLVMGDTAGEKIMNVKRALDEKRIRVVQAVFGKS